MNKILIALKLLTEKLDNQVSGKSKLYAIFFIVCFIVAGMQCPGQNHSGIETIRDDYLKLSAEAIDIFIEYDSLISIRNQLQNQINLELEIYLSCETAYNDKFESFQLINAPIEKRRLISELRKLELDKDELYNNLSLKVKMFNLWNLSESKRIQQSFHKNIEPEVDKLQLLQEVLTDYTTRIDDLQKNALFKMEQYEDCKTEQLPEIQCDEYKDAYVKIKGLAEAYMKKYNEVLGEREGVNSISKTNYDAYRNDYADYFSEYQLRKYTLDSLTRYTEKKLKILSFRIDSVRPVVDEIIREEMKQDIYKSFRKEQRKIQIIDKNFEKELGSLDYYQLLKTLQHKADLMVSTLNPELEIQSLKGEIINRGKSLKMSSKGEKLTEIVLLYPGLLSELQTLIKSYDEIPYFCLNAYPQYSNELVEKNLEIIDNALGFTNKELEDRTNKFMEISEIDLSGTEFSMELVFQGHKNLEKLNLSNTAISSLRFLNGTNLRWLDLSNTNISRQDLIYLKGLKSLEYLNLSNTNLHKKDINNLCYYLKLKRKNCIIR